MGKGRAEKPYFRDHMEAGRRPGANDKALNDQVMNPIKAAKIERAKKAEAKNAKAANFANSGKAAQAQSLAQKNSQPHNASNKTVPAGKGSSHPLDGKGLPYITLVQFLKSINAVETGGAGKHKVRAGGILVNGQDEKRPSRKLHAGDKVKIAGTEHTVILK